eukprot:TRINITY_DN1777_c0_g7_i1.p1 TRINITY_DN1777_c0_g7~~TRINITY_DN1777_c0_g7_i1.p1  ORF type:complete len:426 (+),score=113.62 TRINITY_DN1777_c0_g7_i1:65-1279(+)
MAEATAEATGASDNESSNMGDDGEEWHSFHSMEEWQNSAAGPTPEHKQLPDGFAAGFTTRFEHGSVPDYTYPGDYLTSWHLQDELVEKLGRGTALFGFTCKTGAQLDANERHLLGIAINKTCFEDEERDNGCPVINCTSLSEQEQGMTFMIARTMYVLPGVSLDAIQLDDFVTAAYHQNCQPAGTKVWDDCKARGDINTFRITKPIIPYIFKMTIQFRCSMFSDEELHELAPLFGGLRVDKAVLLERTKRNIQSQDMTKKSKSILLFHRLPGRQGLMAGTVSFIINSSLPRMFASIIDRVGSLGTAEAAETASKTRKYLDTVTQRLQDPFPAPPPPPAPREERRDEPAAASLPAQPPSVSSVPLSPPECLHAKAVIRRSRIRPPGCSDESQYALRSRVTCVPDS